MTVKNFGIQGDRTLPRTTTTLRQMLVGGRMELKDQGIVSSSRLATRDDITGVLGLAHVYELEKTFKVSEARPTIGSASR